MMDAKGSVGAPLMSLDEIIEHLPLGPYHWILASIAGCLYIADAMEVQLVNYIGYCAGEEWSLSDAEIATIVATPSIGAIFGTLLFGHIADVFGRRVGILVFGATISIFGFTTAFAPNYGSLVAFRIIVGMGIGGVSIPFDAIAELTREKFRFSFLGYVELYFVLGNLVMILFAWLLLKPYGWRFLCMITAIPIASATVAAFYFFPESPRWLLLQGRKAEAKETLNYIFERNSAVMPPCILKDDPRTSEDSVFLPAKLFETRAGTNITLRLFVLYFGYGFDYFGITLYIFNLSDKNDGEGSQCDFDYIPILISQLGATVGSLLMVFPYPGKIARKAEKKFYVSAIFLTGLFAFLMGLDFNYDSSVVFGTLATITSTYFMVSSRTCEYMNACLC